MKRLPLLLFFLTAAAATGQDLPSRLQWIPSSSVERDWLESLYLLRGLALPSSSGPFTVEETLIQLEKVSKSDLADGFSRAYTQIEALGTPRALYKPDGNVAVDTALAVSLETYIGLGNPDNRVWERGWSERPAVFDWINKFWLTPYFFLQFHLDARQDPLVVQYADQPWTSNILTGLDQLDGFFPSQGYLSAGLPHLDIKWGRGPLEWGQGLSGNLLLSNAAGVHDFVALSTYWDWFKIQLLYMDMDSYTLNLNEDLGYGGPLAEGTTTLRPGLAATNAFGHLLVADALPGDSSMDVSRRLVSHRFEFRMPGNVNLTLTEALLFNATTFELRYLMPMFVYHNWFHQWNSNPNFTVEVEWTPVQGLGFYGVLLGDYVTTTFKDQWFEDPHPLAMGYQVGAKMAHSWGPGILTQGLEGVYLDPFTYLDEAVDWVSLRRVLTNFQGFRTYEGGQRQVMIIDQPLGYFLGPDSAVVHYQVGYDIPGDWSVVLTLQAQQKGLVTLRSLHPLVTNSLENDPDNVLPDQDAGKSTLWSSDAMRTLLTSLAFHWNLSPLVPDWQKTVFLDSQLSLKWVKNGFDPLISQDPLKPVKGNNYFDFQWSLGMTIKF